MLGVPFVRWWPQPYYDRLFCRKAFSWLCCESNSLRDYWRSRRLARPRRSQGPGFDLPFGVAGLLDRLIGIFHPQFSKAIFNLGTLGRNDASATPMSDLFRGGIP